MHYLPNVKPAYIFTQTHNSHCEWIQKKSSAYIHAFCSYNLSLPHTFWWQGRIHQTLDPPRFTYTHNYRMSVSPKIIYLYTAKFIVVCIQYIKTPVHQHVALDCFYHIVEIWIFSHLSVFVFFLKDIPT